MGGVASSVKTKLKNTVIGFPFLNLLIVGPKASGKSTALFKIKYPKESLLILPTIGLNLESINYKEKQINMYDVSIGEAKKNKTSSSKNYYYTSGSPSEKDVSSSTDRSKVSTTKLSGKSYDEVSNSNLNLNNEGEKKTITSSTYEDFQNVDAIMFFLDSQEMKKESYQKSTNSMFYEIISLEKFKGVPILVMANKMDLKGCCTTEEIAEIMGLYKLRERKWFIREAQALKEEGLMEGIDWILSNAVVNN